MWCQGYGVILKDNLVNLWITLVVAIFAGGLVRLEHGVKEIGCLSGSYIYMRFFSRLLGSFFTNSMWKAISAVRVGSLRLIESVTALGLGIMSPPPTPAPRVSWEVFGSLITQVVREILQFVASVFCNILV